MNYSTGEQANQRQWGSRLWALQCSIQADSKKLRFNKFVLTMAFFGPSESGCQLMQKEEVDRMMIPSLSVLSKYRWYSV